MERVRLLQDHFVTPAVVTSASFSRNPANLEGISASTSANSSFETNSNRAETNQPEPLSMAAAALFRDGMNNVQATLIEQCMEAGELEDAMNYAFDLLNKGYISTYHCGIAHLAIASISITQAHAGHATPDIHHHLRSALECFQRLIFHFNTSPPSESIPEGYLQKLVCCEAKALDLKEQFRGWTREKFGGELEEFECE